MRSTNVAAPLLAAAAMAMLGGCHSHEQAMQRCVDENNRVVDDSLCQQPGQQQPDGHGGFLYIPSPFRYYYGGFGDYRVGTIVGEGSYTPSVGVTYSTTTRGGFGSSFGGGASGAEGAGE